MSYVYSIVTVVAIFSMLTLALNLQFGQGGVINFGLVAYFMVGAYTYAVLTQSPPTAVDEYAFGLEMSPFLAIPIAVAVAVVFAYVIAKPAFRLQPEYLALATFAFAQVLESVLLNVRSLANGSLGLSGIEPPAAMSIPFENYDMWFMIGVVVLLVVVYALVSRLTRSPFGSALRACRDDELAAAAIGKRVNAFRMKAFLVGAALAGLAGVAFTSYTTVATPGIFTADVTFTAFIALVIGGVGRNSGAVVGAAIFFGIEQLLDLVPLSGDTAQLVIALRTIVFGLVLILVLRFAPQGLMGIRLRRRSSRSPIEPKAVRA